LPGDYFPVACATSMAGLRVGFAMGQATLIEALTLWLSQESSDGN